MPEIPISLPEVVTGDDSLLFGQWLVDDGEVVMHGERIAEVLMAGVLIHVAAPREGTLVRSHLMPGEPLTVTSTLGVILADDEESAGE